MVGIFRKTSKNFSTETSFRKLLKQVVKRLISVVVSRHLYQKVIFKVTRQGLHQRAKKS
jgi:hypothetical protein